MKKWLSAIVLCQAALPLLAQTVADPAPPATGAPSAAGPASGARAAGRAPVIGKLAPSGFKCGGVGQDEQERFKREAPDHDLLVTFSTPGGAYVADVDVEVTRGTQVIAQGVCRGPLMLLDVRLRGRYEIRARSGGNEQRKTVVLGAKPQQLSFVWPR